MQSKNKYRIYSENRNCNLRRSATFRKLQRVTTVNSDNCAFFLVPVLFSIEYSAFFLVHVLWSKYSAGRSFGCFSNLISNRQ